MKFSEKWLREWIVPEIDSNILYDQISNSGIEFEYKKIFEPIFNGVIVGKIVECILHNKFKKLKIVQVDIGAKKLLNIVCGASNCRNGIKVAVATVGAILPKNIKINKRIIQGELSEGMLCSFFELGMFYTNKIIEFSEEVSIGICVNNYLSLKDNIIKVSVTPNRPDGLSILGLSRNISAINNLKIESLKNKSIFPLIQKNINIYIKAKKECFNFSGRIINNININIDTPFWMKKKLFLSDNLSDNIITNIINYVLIELGQPLNVLNIDNIHDCIIVRMAQKKEDITLKNNLKIYLDEDILVFSDTNKILSIPGNINSYVVDINNNTKNIFLTSYLIDKQSILNIIKKMGSNKILEYYNYGIDSCLQNYAIEYATDLIIKICGGIPGPISYGNIDDSLYSTNNRIKLHHEKLNQISGFFIDAPMVSKILYNLGYQLIIHKKYWNVVPPSWRFDILIEEDVISDILRIYGYNNVCLTPLQEELNISKKNELIDLLLDKSELILINKGYYEVINYGFINPKVQKKMFPDHKKILVSNPISQDMSCMRSSLWPGLLKTVVHNTNRQQKSLRFFESGLCFSIDKEKNLGIKQELFLSAVISGDFSKENWYSSKIRKVDFYDLKGDLECMLESICNLNHIEFRHNVISGLHPEQSASIYLKKKHIGSIGAIDPRLENFLSIKSSTFLFEILLDNFPEIKLSQFQEISKFPTIQRDIAILISEDVPVSDIINACKNFFVHKKVEINLFDVYSYKEFSHKKKSLGISFIFQDKQKTLQDIEINSMMNDCIGVLNKKFQVILRK